MDQERANERLSGCYVTVPTMFRDSDLEVDYAATKRNVRFLLDRGIKTGNAVLLAGGAAGDFSTMTFDERVQTAEAIVEEAGGRIAVVMGAQTTSTREVARLAHAAERVGAEFIQVSCPFYFLHTEEDFLEYVRAAAEAADIGIVVYNTFWTSRGVSVGLVERLKEIPNIVGLKWSAPTAIVLGFEEVVAPYHDRFCIIDNQMRFPTSHMLGARGFECHTVNYWPEWGVRLMQLLNDRKYVEVQQEIIKVALPFYQLWREMEAFTVGDGYLDKLCMELVGLDSSRCRPPTRDVRPLFRGKARQMLHDVGCLGS